MLSCTQSMEVLWISRFETFLLFLSIYIDAHIHVDVDACVEIIIVLFFACCPYLKHIDNCLLRRFFLLLFFIICDEFFHFLVTIFVLDIYRACMRWILIFVQCHNFNFLKCFWGITFSLMYIVLLWYLLFLKDFLI